METIVLRGSVVVGAVADCRDPLPTIANQQIDQKLSSSNRLVGRRSLTNPTTFLPLADIGTGKTLAKVTFLSLQVTGGRVAVRLTRSDSTTSVVDVSGVLILSVDSDLGYTLVEVQGTGDVEYVASSS